MKQEEMDAAAALYRGSLEDFVRRRDVLAKDVRAGGNRAEADRIKSLRKPSRTAWALNLAATGRALHDLVSAVEATVAAQSTGGDVRSAMATLREAVRGFAADAADAGAAHGGKVDSNALSAALLAVLSDTDAFEQLQHGCLCEIPDAGGLDFLARLPAAPVLQLHRAAPVAADSAVQGGQEEGKRAAIERAEQRVAECRRQAAESLRELNRAETDLDAADRRLKEAQNAVTVATTKRDAARLKAEEASALTREAEDQLEEANSRVSRAPRRS
jgi:hypothetical protein